MNPLHRKLRWDYIRKYKKQAVIIALTGIFAWYVSVFYCQFMLIQGESMHPAYHRWQFVLLWKHNYEPNAGDVVAFECESLDALLVKRIVAVPGDTLQILDGILFVNGKPDASASAKGKILYGGIAGTKLVLLEDEYFVLGDNYECSKDSRYREIGCIKRECILGKIVP